MTDDDLSIQQALGLTSAAEEDTLAAEERTSRFAAALRRMREDPQEAARIDRIVEATGQAVADITKQPPSDGRASPVDGEQVPRAIDPAHGEIHGGIEAISDAKVLIVSIAARLAGMHPQTLRQYARMGLVQPARTSAGGLRYSERDVALLREVQRLSQEEGVNLAGIKRIIEIDGLLNDLRQRAAELEDELIRTRTRLAYLEAANFPRRDMIPSDQFQAHAQPSGR